MSIRSPFSCSEIGTWLAHADDHQQAEVLNAMAKELLVCCGDGYDNQLCYLSGHLNNQAGQMVEALAEYNQLRTKEEGAQ